jgi:hypothetical protein
MPHTGIASLPLHGGKAPQWLFRRMVKLAESIADVMVYEHGQRFLLNMLSDPFWFQALSCVLGFDWHSSGTTTVTCGALKEALGPQHSLLIAGGKGAQTNNTLSDIANIGGQFNLHGKDIDKICYASRMAAKVDNAAVQDGYSLYHHVVIISEQGDWSVIQQGMNPVSRYARRYHWIEDQALDFVCEPHASVMGRKGETMNLTARESKTARDISVDLANDGPRHLLHDWALLTLPPTQTTLDGQKRTKPPHLNMPRTMNWNRLQHIYDIHPKDYRELLSINGVGPATIRALAYIAELMYGAKTSWHDPIKFSFALGGKDGVPYPVDRKAMDEATNIIRQGIDEARLGKADRLRAIRRLKAIVPA